MLTNILLAIIAIEVGALVYLLYQPIDIPDNSGEESKAAEKTKHMLDEILKFEKYIYDMSLETRHKVAELSAKKKTPKKTKEDDKNV